MERSQLKPEHCFYSAVPSRQQSKIYLFLHIHHQIPLDIIIKCIELYVSENSGLQSNRSVRDLKKYAKQKNMDKLKSFRLEALYYSDAWANNFDRFLTIVTEQTGIIFPESVVIKRNIIPNLLNLKY